MNAIERLNAALAGRYTIERELGAGGMATVFLAHDVKHDRRVALKVLKPELAAVLGAERFVVEIKTTAAMQHPHILPLFDSGAADGFLFYVMPFIEGETLRDKLNRETQLGVDEAVRIAREVLDALEYAHEHGIVHRDVKPENILLHGGHAMVADFGIALAVSAAAGGRMTETGLSLGTPHYMSPEQATAEKEITARSDVYSLGSVLYEMLTGQPPHVGGSAQQIIMRIITDSARPVSEIRKSVPANVVAAVAKSLEKLPADRFESAKAFSEALGNSAYTSASTIGVTGYSMAGRRAVSLRLFAMTTTLLAALLLVATVWGWRAAFRTENGSVARFPLTFPPDTRLEGSGFPALAISPDGNIIVFVAARSGNTMLYARALSDPNPHPIPGTENARVPFFSPDGKWLGFVALGQLKKVEFASGAVVPLPALQSFGVIYGATWTKNDVIVVSAANQLISFPAAGGTPRVVAPLDTAHLEQSQRWPFALDDGETVLYVSWTGSVQTSRIGVASLTTGATRLLDLPSSTFPLSVLENKLIYASATNALVAVPFDERRARLTGSPVQVVADVGVATAGYATAAISRSGSLVFRAGAVSSQLVLADLQGHERVLVPDAKNYSFPRFSPDGKRLAVSITTGGSTDVWIYDIASGTPTRLTSGNVDERPEWTPDGKRVLFRSVRPEGTALGWQPSDGSGAAELLQKHVGQNIDEGVISHDGHVLAYRLNGPGAPQDLWYRRLDGDTTPKPIAATPALEYAPRFSPDDRWVAYTSDQSGSMQVYVQAFPALGARYAVTAAGGTTPIWSPDGRRIYYIANGQINAATITTTPSFTVVSRQQLFEGAYALGPTGVHAEFDLAPDGQHFVFVKHLPGDTPVTVVLDWKYELRARTAQAVKR
jgi:serine/threonine-protein kinase